MSAGFHIIDDRCALRGPTSRRLTTQIHPPEPEFLLDETHLKFSDRSIRTRFSQRRNVLFWIEKMLLSE